MDIPQYLDRQDKGLTCPACFPRAHTKRICEFPSVGTAQHHSPIVLHAFDKLRFESLKFSIFLMDSVDPPTGYLLASLGCQMNTSSSMLLGHFAVHVCSFIFKMLTCISHHIASTGMLRFLRVLLRCIMCLFLLSRRLTGSFCIHTHYHPPPTIIISRRTRLLGDLSFSFLISQLLSIRRRLIHVGLRSADSPFKIVTSISVFLV